MPGTRYEIHFRATSQGSATSGSGYPFAETAPMAYATAVDLWGTDGVTRGGLTFGFVTPGTTQDLANAASNARINGKTTFSSVSTVFRVNLPDGAGTYRFWLAVSNLTSAIASIATQIRGGDGSPGSGINAGGSPGTVRHTVAGGTTTSLTVLDALGVEGTISNWTTNDGFCTGGGYVDITFAADHFFVTRPATGTANGYLNTLAFQSLGATLTDLTFKDDVGKPLTGIYAKQPAGKLLARVSATAGQTAYTLLGTLASYFVLAAVPAETGGGFGIYPNPASARLPDNLAGTLTTGQLGVRQTDAGSTNGPTRDTWLTVPIISSGGRVADSSVWGLISTETYAHIAATWSVVSTKWAGYTGQTIPAGNKQTVNSLATLNTALNSITPDGTSWYAIYLQDDAAFYDGFVAPPNLDFGTGGLLVTNAAGHSPLIEWQWCASINTHQAGIHFEGLTIPGKVNSPTSAWTFLWLLPNSTTYLRAVFKNIKFGRRFATDPTAYNPATGYSTAPSFVKTLFGKEISFINCEGRGFYNWTELHGTRIHYDKGTHLHERVADAMAYCEVTYIDDDRSLLVDANNYKWVEDYTDHDVWGRFDVLVDEGVHGDSPFQHRALSNYRVNPGYPATVTSFPLSFRPGYTVTGGSVGRLFVFSNRVYQATAAGTFGGTGPVHTSGTVANGTASLAYIGPFNAAGAQVHIVCLNHAMQIGGDKFNDGGQNGNRIAPITQVHIDNYTRSDGINVKLTMSAVNCFWGNSGSKGIQIGYGHANVEFCSFPSGAARPAVPAVGGGSLLQLASVVAWEGTARVRKTLLGGVTEAVVAASDPMSLGDSVFSSYQEGNEWVDWRPSSARPPTGRLSGGATFVQTPVNLASPSDPRGWHYPTIDALDRGGATPADLLSAMAKLMHPVTAGYLEAGARPREVYTPVLTDTATGATLSLPPLTISQQSHPWT